MHKALHPRDDVDRLYVSRKEGARGLASIEGSVEESIRLEDYIVKSRERQITATSNNTENIRINRMEINPNPKMGR